MDRLYQALVDRDSAALQELTDTDIAPEASYWPELGFHIANLITYSPLSGLQLSPQQIHDLIGSDPRFLRHVPTAEQRSAAGQAHGPLGGAQHPPDGEYLLAAEGPDTPPVPPPAQSLDGLDITREATEPPEPVEAPPRPSTPSRQDAATPEAPPTPAPQPNHAPPAPEPPAAPPGAQPPGETPAPGPPPRRRRSKSPPQRRPRHGSPRPKRATRGRERAYPRTQPGPPARRQS